MDMYVAAHGEVVAAPAEVTTDEGTAIALVLRTVQPPGAGVEFEVVCSGPQVGRPLLDQVLLGDRLVVLGTLRLDAVRGPIEDAGCAARVTLNAATVAVDLRPVGDDSR
jgi:hypothetical protein